MIASSGVATSMTHVLPPDTRTPEQKEADRLSQAKREAEYKAAAELERRETTDRMMQESAPLLKLIGEKVTGVLREREKDPEDDYDWADAPLVVHITTESGLVLRLTGKSHDYDGGDASILVEVVSE